MKKLEGKVALITGAAVGLGKGIATVYAKYGAKMCLVDLLPEVRYNLRGSHVHCRVARSMILPTREFTLPAISMQRWIMIRFLRM